MAVYVITGTSKGIGFEFLKQIAQDKKNLVIGLVRDKKGTESKISTELGNLPNVHILHADLTKYDSIQKSAEETTKIVGDRGVDYLVANGALVPHLDAYGPIGSLKDKPKEVDDVSNQLWNTNVVGNIHLFNLFIPLVLKGKIKKVITISTGMADLEFVNDYDVDVAALYAASKAAMNIIVAKFNVQYKKDGVLFMSISPGVVEVGRYSEATPEEMAGLAGFAGNLSSYAPDFQGPITPEQSVQHIRSTWEKASIANGFGGSFVSHFGTKKWV